MFDSGDLEAEHNWKDVAVDIKEGIVVFDNCEFKNITVDYSESSIYVDIFRLISNSIFSASLLDLP